MGVASVTPVRDAVCAFRLPFDTRTSTHQQTASKGKTRKALLELLTGESTRFLSSRLYRLTNSTELRFEQRSFVGSPIHTSLEFASKPASPLFIILNPVYTRSAHLFIPREIYAYLSKYLLLASKYVHARESRARSTTVRLHFIVT